MRRKPQVNFYLMIVVAAIIFSLLGLIQVLAVGERTELINLSRRSDASATIQLMVSPIGSEVILDRKTAGVTPLILSVNPGKHLIHVEHPNYNPYIIEITVKPNEIIKIERRLTFRKFVKNIANNAKAPQWYDNNAIIYINRSDGGIFRYYMTGNQDELIEAPYQITEMAFAGGFLFTRDFSGEIPELDLISPTDGSLTTIGLGYSRPAWKNNEEGFFFLGWSVGEFNSSIEGFHLWVVKPGNPPKPLSLPEITRAISATSIHWSTDEQWLMAQSSDFINIWNFDGESFSYLREIKSSYSASWAPIGNQLVYVQGDGSVYYIEKIDENVPAKFLIGNASPPIYWMPRGDQVVFKTYNPSTGSSSFWAVDVNNGVRTLLADSSLILGRVTDFAISPDGTRIAYTNDLNHLNILFIGE